MLNFACTYKKKDISAQSLVDNPIIDSSVRLTLEKFCLQYDASFVLDTNSLIFYRKSTFDTSFLIHLRKDASRIRGVYYEVLPSYHNDIDDYSISENELLFFEGYSFSIDSLQWEEIKTKAEKIVNNKQDKNSEACRDCAEYGLYFGHLFRSGSIRSELPSLYHFIKGFLLDRFIKQRVPIWHKATRSS